MLIFIMHGTTCIGVCFITFCEVTHICSKSISLFQHLPPFTFAMADDRIAQSNATLAATLALQIIAMDESLSCSFIKAI